jgi:hypothetical protein
MADTPVIVVKGADGEPPGAPVDGKPAPPLVHGDGTPGTASGKKCTVRATNGHPAHGGGAAPPALKGARGLDAPHVTLTIGRIHATSKLVVAVTGGSGGKGVSGGKGGDGGAGGDAGLQPAACAKKYGDTVGGTGGAPGAGGKAGDGGDAGSGGIATLVWDESLGSGFLPGLTSTSGPVGHPGVPGDPGNPGQGGLNGDGKTRADPGGSGDPGGIGELGGQGKAGTASLSSVANPDVQVRLIVIPQTSQGT